MTVPSVRETPKQEYRVTPLLLVFLVTLGLPAYAALILIGASLTTLAVVDQKMIVKDNQVKEVKNGN